MARDVAAAREGSAWRCGAGSANRQTERLPLCSSCHTMEGLWVGVFLWCRAGLVLAQAAPQGTRVVGLGAVPALLHFVGPVGSGAARGGCRGRNGRWANLEASHEPRARVGWPR